MSNASSPYVRSQPSPISQRMCEGSTSSTSGAARLRSTISEGTFTKRQFVGVPPTSRIRVSDVGANSPTNARILRFRKRSVARKRRCWRRRFIGLSTTYHDRVPTKTPSRRAASCVAGSGLRRCSSRQKIEPTNSALRSPAASGHWTNSRCTTGRTSRPVRESPEVRCEALDVDNARTVDPRGPEKRHCHSRAGRDHDPRSLPPHEPPGEAEVAQQVANVAVGRMMGVGDVATR